MATSLTDAGCRECGGSTGTTVADHEAATDPHPQYLTEASAAATYEPIGQAASAVSTHEAAGDPHPAYLLEADASSTYETQASAAAHIADAGDPHSAAGYTKVAAVEDRTGWASYVDTAITSGSPLTLVAATATDLPNAANTVDEDELPSDATELYETTGDTVTFRQVDELVVVQVEVTVEAVAATDWLDIWLEDSGAVEFGRSTFALPKGTTAQRLVHRFAVPANAALVASGGTVRVESNAAVDLYDISFLIARGHLTRT